MAVILLAFLSFWFGGCIATKNLVCPNRRAARRRAAVHRDYPEYVVWHKTEKTRSPAAYRSFLRRFPSGAYSILARSVLDRLEGRKPSIPVSRETRAILYELSIGDVRARVKAAKELGSSHDTMAARPLTATLKYDTSEAVQLAAIVALADLRAGSSVGALAIAATLRRYALDSKGFCCCLQSSPLFPGRLEYVNGLILRKEAVEAMGVVGDNSAVSTLVALLRDTRHPILKGASLWDLANHADDEVRVAAAVALGRIGDTSAVRHLVASLGDANVFVRCVSLQALAEIGDHRAFEPAIRLAKASSNLTVLDYVAYCLATLNSSQAVQRLIGLLQETDAPVQARAAYVLAGMGPLAISAVPALAADLPESGFRAVRTSGYPVGLGRDGWEVFTQYVRGSDAASHSDDAAASLGAAQLLRYSLMTLATSTGYSSAGAAVGGFIGTGIAALRMKEAERDALQDQARAREENWLKGHYGEYCKMLRLSAAISGTTLETTTEVEFWPRQYALSKIVGADLGNDGAVWLEWWQTDTTNRKRVEKASEAEVYFVRALQYDRCDDHVAAIREYGVAISLNPSHAAAYLNRGIDHWLVDDVKSASSDLLRALSLSPQGEVGGRAEQLLQLMQPSSK